MARRRKKGNIPGTLVLAFLMIIMGLSFGNTSHEDKIMPTTKALTSTTSPTVAIAHTAPPTVTPSPTPAPTATPEPVEEEPAINYILNMNTHKFHYPYCNSVNEMKEKNKYYFSGTREEAINKGYVPCKNCDP